MYMQYFIGYSSFSDETPFDASLFVEIRSRLGIDQINAMNERIIHLATTPTQSPPMEYPLKIYDRGSVSTTIDLTAGDLATWAQMPEIWRHSKKLILIFFILLNFVHSKVFTLVELIKSMALTCL